MSTKTIVLALAGLLLAMTSVPFGADEAEATHVKRIVWPYGVDERHIPVVAGFKVVPDPLACDTGVAGPGTPLLATSFEEPVTFGKEIGLTFHSSSAANYNLWHQTTFAGRGTDAGHSGAGKLYFGNDATGIVKVGFQRLGGAAVFEVDIPEGPTPYNVVFTTKWEGEWFEGYDHMWVEVQPEDGRTYVLCTLNVEGRGDSSSNDFSTAGSCSPYRVGVCPSSARGLNFFGAFTTLDADAPHWDQRYVQIPSIFNGQHVKVRLTYDSADGVSNNFMGWMIDDLSITDIVIPTAPPVGPLV